MTKILDGIDKPGDLKNLTVAELEQLAAEIREEMISVVSANGGHLASNLGVIELTLALHRVFDAPRDKIVWDVGHQTYTHKLVTGRRKQFTSLRQYGGLSGFATREEGEYDIFGAGHASTSVSAALGIAVARDFDGGPVGAKTIAISVGEEVRTIEDVYEPYLIQIGFLKRTPQGREVTSAAKKHLKYPQKTLI